MNWYRFVGGPKNGEVMERTIDRIYVTHDPHPGSFDYEMAYLVRHSGGSDKTYFMVPRADGLWRLFWKVRARLVIRRWRLNGWDIDSSIRDTGQRE